MNDRAVELLEQYEIEVLRTRKGRGAIVCDTSQGCLILKEYSGNAAAADLIAGQRYEESLYYKYKEYYGYVFYIGQKR